MQTFKSSSSTISAKANAWRRSGKIKQKSIARPWLKSSPPSYMRFSTSPLLSCGKSGSFTIWSGHLTSRLLSPAQSLFQISQYFVSVACGKFACVVGVSPPLRFCRPGRFTRPLLRFGNGIPEQVYQPRPFRRGQAKKLFLNGGNAHGQNLQLIMVKANSFLATLLACYLPFFAANSLLSLICRNGRLVYAF
jgi:hypothetical protein